MNVFDFSVKAQDGTEVSLGDFKGKVLLVVNTATGCRFTPQYTELQAMYEEFKDQGLEILDFPCNLLQTLKRFAKSFRRFFSLTKLLMPLEGDDNE